MKGVIKISESCVFVEAWLIARIFAIPPSSLRSRTFSWLSGQWVVYRYRTPGFPCFFDGCLPFLTWCCWPRLESITVRMGAIKIEIPWLVHNVSTFANCYAHPNLKRLVTIPLASPVRGLSTYTFAWVGNTLICMCTRTSISSYTYAYFGKAVHSVLPRNLKMDSRVYVRIHTYTVCICKHTHVRIRAAQIP